MVAQDELDRELDELGRMRPAERIKKLKEIGEKRKKEIEHAENLLKVAEIEATAIESERRKKVPIPQIAALDISLLMTADEKMIFRTRRFAEEKEAQQAPAPPKAAKTLDEMAGQEAINDTQANPSVIYGAAVESAKKELVYERTETVTGAQKEDKHVRTFYENAKGFYEKGEQSDFYRQHTVTGAEEEAAQRKRKG